VFNATLTFQDDVPSIMNRMTNAIAQSLSAPFKLQLQGIASSGNYRVIF
jgi:hypothetical protein